MYSKMTINDTKNPRSLSEEVRPHGNAEHTKQMFILETRGRVNGSSLFR
jgi:hypothetical protein